MFNVLILGIASFFTDISTEMIYPLLPLYLTSVLGVLPAIVGLIEGLAESTAALLRVFAGYFSDRLGRRKPITIAGYSVSALGKLILYLSATWPLVLFARLIDRFGKGIRTAPRDAIIADSVDKNQRGAGFGLNRALDSLGAVVGVALAYFFFISVRENYSFVFLISFIPAVLGVIALLFVREKRRAASPLQRSTLNDVQEGVGRSDGNKPPAGTNTKSQVPTTPQPWWHGLQTRWQVLDTRLKAFILIVFTFNLANSSNEFLLLRATNLGYSPASAILLYLAYNVVYAVISYPAGRLSDRIGRKTLLVGGYLTYGLLYLGFGFATGAWLFPLFGLYGVYSGITDGVEKALVSDLAPADQRATLIGLHDTAVGVGLLPASLFAGFLWDAFGAPAPFFFGGALGIIAAAALWLFL